MIGFGGGIILLLLFYFFNYIPALEKAFHNGRAECEKSIDTLFIPGKTEEIIKENIIYLYRRLKPIFKGSNKS